MLKEKMNFSGAFYPDNEKEILRYFDFFNKTSKKVSTKLKPKAIIVPHAGYIYSGKSANYVYEIVSKYEYKDVVVIGPSHRYYLDGASISKYDLYETPLGELTINKKLVNSLQEEYAWLNFDENAHMEHSTEVQMPFIKKYINTQVIEIVYGKLFHNELSSLIEKLINDEVLVVISTDLSHFYNLEEANKLDKKCIDGILNKDMKTLNDDCEACGIVGVKALVQASTNLGLEVEFIDYSTSYDATKDKNRVVGYSSFIFGV